MEKVSIVWRARGDLNPGPPAPQAGALILAELRALRVCSLWKVLGITVFIFLLVGVLFIVSIVFFYIHLIHLISIAYFLCFDSKVFLVSG